MMRIQERSVNIAEVNKANAKAKDSSAVSNPFDSRNAPQEADGREAKKSLNPLFSSTRLNSYNIPVKEDDIEPEPDPDYAIQRMRDVEGYMLREYQMEGDVLSRKAGTVPEEYAAYFFKSANENFGNKIVVELPFGGPMVLDTPEGFDRDGFDEFMEKEFPKLMDKYVFGKNDYDVTELETLFEDELMRKFA